MNCKSLRVRVRLTEEEALLECLAWSLSGFWTQTAVYERAPRSNTQTWQRWFLPGGLLDQQVEQLRERGHSVERDLVVFDLVRTVSE